MIEVPLGVLLRPIRTPPCGPDPARGIIQDRRVSRRSPQGADIRAVHPDAVTSRTERRVSLAVIAVGIVVFVALLLAVPPFFLTFDEAKYIGIGYNLVDGLGPQTPFGGYFLPHAPVWSAILVVSGRVAGIDPLDTGHVLNAHRRRRADRPDRASGLARPAGRRRARRRRLRRRHVPPRPDPNGPPRRPGRGARARLSRPRARRGPPGRGVVGDRGRRALRARVHSSRRSPCRSRPCRSWRRSPWGTAMAADRSAAPAGRSLAAAVGVSWWFSLVADLSGRRVPPGYAGVDARPDRRRRRHRGGARHRRRTRRRLRRPGSGG